MAQESPHYKKLSRSHRQFGGYTRLWLAPDYLLQVTCSGYVETYQRFYFRDIKGIFTLETDRRIYWGIFSGIFSLLVGVPFMTAADSPSSPLFLVGIGLLVVLSTVLLAWNHWLGAGCKVYLVTGVQTVQLPALVRRSAANRAVALLASEVNAAQADLIPVTPMENSVPSQPQEPPQPSV